MPNDIDVNTQSKALTAYLQASSIIDFASPAILELAALLAEGSEDISATQGRDYVIAKRCFEWVRDNIRHSWDFQSNPVTCMASSVLKHTTGYCYSKSHLLAALLRANNIPAGFCYQRLSLEDNGAPYCLHGLNAVYLQDYGWYRIDARGNKDGVDAQFVPPVEQLAFPTDGKLEADFPEIWPEPLPVVVQVLTSFTDIKEAYDNLPDIPLAFSV